jgi:Flp pilus assembly protein TadD
MRRRSIKTLGHGLVALAILAVPLTGCSMAGLSGASTFGNSKLAAAEIPNIGDYTADTALAEARNHFRNNDFGYSAALYKRVAELTPESPEGYIGLGASYDRLRRFDLSDRVYASLFKLSGGTAQYYNNVGYSYMLRGNLAQAHANFRKAQQLAPDSVVVANNLEMLARAAAAARA